MAGPAFLARNHSECFFALQRAFAHFSMPEQSLDLKSAYQRLFLLQHIFAHLTKLLIFSPLFR
jgi:hypothetical protein